MARNALGAESRPAPHTIDINGASLAYLDVGQGEPVVCVHGSLDDYRSWQGQLLVLSQHYRVIAYSRRYHYPNLPPAPGAGYCATAHADDLIELVARLNLGPVHLLTSSFGGVIALCALARHPQLARSLVLGEPPLLPWLAQLPAGLPLLSAFETQVWAPAREAFGRGDLEDGVRLFLDGVMGQAKFRHLSPERRRPLMENAAEMAAETRDAEYFPAFSRDEARRIHQPVLLVQGAASSPLFHMLTRELLDHLPQAAAVILPGVSHVVHAADPDAYNQLVLGFLAGAAGSTPPQRKAHEP